MSHIVILSGLLFIFAVHILIKAETNPNNFIFERLECDKPNPQFLSELKCETRTVARNVVKVNLTMVLKKELKNNVWLRTTVYYRFSTYTKIFDITENVCGYLNGTSSAPVVKKLVENIVHLELQLNFKLQCPLTGTLMGTHAGINASHFSLPMVPAGRYRFELSFTRGKNGPSIVSGQVYVSVSDYRVVDWR